MGGGEKLVTGGLWVAGHATRASMEKELRVFHVLVLLLSTILVEGCGCG